MNLSISVIICTHNPRMDYLRQTLEALKSQTLAKDQWELLLIDNASKNPVNEGIDLTWHPLSRCLIESQLGLTPARLRGIKEFRGSILVFVDDDNMLAPDYLEQVIAISKRHPNLGVWGGSITGVFEIDPPNPVKELLGMLAVGEVSKDSWGTIKGFNEACPPGAGMVVRRVVAEKYRERAINDPLFLSVGRKGSMLTSGEDIDLAWLSCEIGYGMGRFRELKLQHFISAGRLTVDYFERLMEGGSYSNVFLFHFHAIHQPLEKKTIWHRLRSIKSWILATSPERRFKTAARRGAKRGMADLRKQLSSAQIKTGSRKL